MISTMDRLSHSDYSRLLDFIAALQEPIMLKDFGAMMVRISSELLPGATIAFDQIHERTGNYYGFDHNVQIDAAEQVKMHARLQEVYKENPIYAYIQSGGQGPIVDLDHLMPKQAFRRTDFYQDIFRPYGINHQVSVLLSRPGWINTLTLNHGRPLPGKMKTLLALATRHIRLAHQAACQADEISAVSEMITAKLTPREQEIFHWVGQGKSNAETAIILGCATRTVEKHMENILQKTSLESRNAIMANSAGKAAGASFS
ncbi:MAG: helix-turn-helix transcriptional regulator, partial [Akkermansiaceae bacterium]|nr:helix-turn-helix transcriptional regulator [Akkermansiaceae bacterium]